MFLSSSIHTLDTKGRVSVPAEFRTLVAGEGFDGIMCWPSFEGPYLEGGGQVLMKRLQGLLESMDPYDEARLAFERAIFGAARRLSFDANGRISLPKDFADYAGLKGKVAFVGLGARFEIWNPEAREEQVSKDRALASQFKTRLKMQPSRTQGGAV